MQSMSDALAEMEKEPKVEALTFALDASCDTAVYGLPELQLSLDFSESARQNDKCSAPSLQLPRFRPPSHRAQSAMVLAHQFEVSLQWQTCQMSRF